MQKDKIKTKGYTSTLYSVARTRDLCGPAAANIVQVTAAVSACSKPASSISLRIHHAIKKRNTNKNAISQNL